MAKHGDGLGYEIVKGVLNGDIIEPITYEKVKAYCKNNGIDASQNHMRVILSNASENTHSPTYKRYFERVGGGEYVILQEFRPKKSYYWLNVDSTKYDWSFSDLKVGRSQEYSNLNPNGNKRKNENCFKSIKVDDLVVAYETGDVKAITAICKVIDKYEDNAELIIEFEKIKDFEVYLTINSMKGSKDLEECNPVNFHRGTLFELEEEHYHIITNMLNELNTTDDIYGDLYKKVQESKKDSEIERRKRLENHLNPVPESFEVKTRAFKRNPDVIAEVLIRANGVCEKCNKEAPFFRASDGTPYLEVHHIKRLADGGEDTVENAIAVCPNCHRELHFG
ncbi:HNH endonuclease [Bacillus salacetis]|uniref:HNH endonuclease n=1 Tax=Bacillus salacetis TaxID=2315464 RepID=A0A3A1QMT3_9BACI|nr:HNH endonuclease [Bacillus salacetis]RIW27624.1 HNH endonuclease [Bacillus salacetis]